MLNNPARPPHFVGFFQVRQTKTVNLSVCPSVDPSIRSVHEYKKWISADERSLVCLNVVFFFLFLMPVGMEERKVSRMT